MLSEERAMQSPTPQDVYGAWAVAAAIFMAVVALGFLV